MTVADPYPETLAELDELPVGSASVSDADRIVRALNRIAVALEARPVQNAPRAPLAALPPVQTVPVQNGGVCPIHNVPWKVVPAGVSKKTGKEYAAFQACSVSGCDQRPPR